jgi:hypothetical protein
MHAHDNTHTHTQVEMSKDADAQQQVCKDIVEGAVQRNNKCVP